MDLIFADSLPEFTQHEIRERNPAPARAYEMIQYRDNPRTLFSMFPYYGARCAGAGFRSLESIYLDNTSTLAMLNKEHEGHNFKCTLAVQDFFIFVPLIVA